MNAKPTRPMQSQHIWLKSKWPAKELDGKTVEFRIWLKPEKPNRRPPAVEGTGKFRTLSNPKGLTRIEITVNQQGRDQYERVETVFFCPQRSADLIEKNPPGSKFDFSLFEFPKA
jgi:hypothetical protein